MSRSKPSDAPKKGKPVDARLPSIRRAESKSASHQREEKRDSESCSRKKSIARRKRKTVFSTNRDDLIHELEVHQLELEMQNQELREAHHRLAEAHDRYLDLFELAPVGYVTLDAQGLIREANIMAASLLGTQRSRLFGTRFKDYVATEARSDWQRYRDAVSQSETLQVRHFPIHRRNRPLVLRVESIAVQDRSAMRCALLDVTEQRRAEEELETINRGLALRVAARTSQLRESNRELRERIAENERIAHDSRQHAARLQTILETAADGIFTVDTRGRIETANPAAERMFGYPGVQLIGRKISSLIPLPHPAMRKRRTSQGTGQQRFIGTWHEQNGLRKDGSTFPIDLTVSGFHDGKRKFAEMVRDITERKRLQWEIVQRVSQEQQSIGRTLHDGVAQHLTAAEMMLGVLEKNLRKRSSDDAKLAADALDAAREAQRQLRATIRGVLPYTVHALGLHAALSELAATTTKLQRVECELQSERAPSIADADRATQLYYIASEAVHNAVRHGHPRRVVIALRGKGAATELSVRDDGVGIRASGGKQGAGLQIMTYRASLLGASLTVSTPKEGGTLVRCVAPNVAR